MEGRNVGTIRGKSPKQDLTSTNDLTIELPEGRESRALEKRNSQSRDRMSLTAESMHENADTECKIGSHDKQHGCVRPAVRYH